MNLQQGFSKIALALGLVLILAGAALAPRPAWASMEDAAIFYDELKQEGQWVDYGDYGPVWYPTQVQENWRPYVDGRWTPSEEGYVFETQEPWAPRRTTTATGCPPRNTAGSGCRDAPGTPTPWPGGPPPSRRPRTPPMSVGRPCRPPTTPRRRAITPRITAAPALTPGPLTTSSPHPSGSSSRPRAFSWA